MIILFKNKKKKNPPITNHNFQIKVLSRLLEEKDKNERLEFLDIFCEILYLIDEKIHGIKRDYKIDTFPKDEREFIKEA